MKVLSTSLLILGFILLFSLTVLSAKRIIPVKYSLDIRGQAEIRKETVKPFGLIIDSLAISLPVFTAGIEKGEWQTTEKGVSYLNISTIPGEKGTAIIYGHNWPNLLGPLKKIKVGESIEITLTDGKKATFQVVKKEEVSPKKVKIKLDADQPWLLLYTCSGFLDNKRLLIYAINIP